MYPFRAQERAAHVALPLVPVKARLAPNTPPPGEKKLDGQVPAVPELAGERLGRLVPAPQAAVAVGRDIRDDVCRRARNPLDDELGGEVRERADSALLPGAHEGAGGPGVDEPGAGRGERDPSPGALQATLDRPGGRCAAAGAEGRMHGQQPERQHAQKMGPGCPQETQRDGTRRSKSHPVQARAKSVTCLERLCDALSTGSTRHAAGARLRPVAVVGLEELLGIADVDATDRRS